MEYQVTELNINRKLIHVINVYIPPSADKQKGLAKLSTIIQDINSLNIIVTGDFNLNSLQDEDLNHLQAFTVENGLVLTSNTPTRLGKHNASAIDHIFIGSNLNFKTDTLFTDFSDHFTLKLILDIEIILPKKTLKPLRQEPPLKRALKNFVKASLEQIGNQ